MALSPIIVNLTELVQIGARPWEAFLVCWLAPSFPPTPQLSARGPLLHLAFPPHHSPWQERPPEDLYAHDGVGRGGKGCQAEARRGKQPGVEAAAQAEGAHVCTAACLVSTR